MKRPVEFLRKYYGIAKYAAFPVLLIIFALLKADKGIDVADASYSLGNYESFGKEGGVWFLLTFLSNAVGKLLTLLPFGHYMLGMRVYTLLVIALLGLISYRFFMTKMPAWLAFLALLPAIGLCWAPSTILYNYLTYFFLTLGAILLFRGLAGGRSICLFAAGLLLGINTFVRFPNNGLEVLLILALWYYAALKGKSFEKTVKETLLCAGGYVLSFAIITIVISTAYQTNALSTMISGVLGISGSASDYTFGEMLGAIVSAYLHGARWAVYMVICALIGIPYFILFNGKYMKLKKLVYCLCIPVLFFVLYKWGMFNFKYYQKESALQWGAIFLLISIGVDIWMLISGQINDDWKLIAAISLIIILITPLGSNNHIWPVLNNLFLIAPVTFWTIYKFARWGRDRLDITGKVPLFSIKAMLCGAVIAFLIQSSGVGCFYVFNDGEDGLPVKYEVKLNDGSVLPRLKGMKTTGANADNLAQLADLSLPEGKYIFYGDIPGLKYYLDAESALSTTWTSLASYPYETFKEELSELEFKIMADSFYPSRYFPNIIISRTALDEYYSDTENGNPKLIELMGFAERYNYRQVFINDMAAVYTQ